jgi:hypothetical protein
MALYPRRPRPDLQGASASPVDLARDGTIAGMKVDFDPNDEDAASSAREELVRDFADWLSEQRTPEPADPDDVDLLLEWKWSYGDGHYALWTVADVDEVLLEHLPRKLSAPLAEAETIPGSLACFVRYLDDVGFLDPAGDTAERIATRARAQTRSFLDAMADPANFGMAKRLMTAAGFEPGEVIDQADLDAAMARFNDLPFEERGRLLGLDEPGGPDDPEVPDLPPLPIRLPLPATELDRVAAGVPLLAQVDAFRQALGADGVKLTKAGNPTLADARRLVTATGVSDRVEGIRSSAELPRLFAVGQVAVGAGAAEVVGNRLRAGTDWSTLPLRERWQRVVDAVLEAGAATLSFGAQTPAPLQLAAIADDGALQFLGMMWLAGEAVPVEAFTEVFAGALELYLEPWALARLPVDLQTSLCAQRLDDVFATLAEAGVVAVEDGRVSLTDAGAEMVGHHLLDAGYDVVPPEDVLDADAPAFLDMVASREVDIDAVAPRWAESRGSAEAADELVEAMVARPEPVRLLEGFAMLGALGDVAVEPVKRAVDTPIAAHAWLFLASAGVVHQDDVPEDCVVQAGLDLFLATAEVGSPADVIELLVGQIPSDDHAGFIDKLAKADHPRTGEMLELIGRHHPAKPVAKHARKQAHRWRSARGGGHSFDR